jgi:hypothetical protein
MKELLYCRHTVIAAALGLVWSGAALAYIGDSFISIPGKPGHVQGTDHKGWIRVEANVWSANKGAVIPGMAAMQQLGFAIGNGPAGVRPGNAGYLTVMVDRSSPDLRLLMDACVRKTLIPELSYAEWSGPARPANFPDYWAYKLSGVEIVDCPAVEGATAQAFVLSFHDVEWLNYDRKQPPIADKPVIPDVRPTEPTGKQQVKSYVITWLGIATDVAKDQCPAMSAKPSEADVFRYMSKEQVAETKAKDGEKGVTYGPESEMRGPHQLNVVYLPGIVPDPGLQEPQSPLAYGIDLDGDDGKGTPPPGIRKHKNYMSPDGRAGIDNQLFTVTGCVPGFRGKQGYRNQTDNARRADGNIVTVVEVSGIDDEQNDDSVEVALIHARDKPIRDNTGSKFIANYTFRPTDDPRFTRYNIRVHGRIVNGVVMTDVIPSYSVYSGQGPAYELINARMRFEPQADGAMRGYLAGYMDWRYLAINRASGYSEGLFNYQLPALWYALKRNADGLKDPVTGDYNGISTVYEIDTVPAFLTAAAAAGTEQAGRTR